MLTLITRSDAPTTLPSAQVQVLLRACTLHSVPTPDDEDAAQALLAQWHRRFLLECSCAQTGQAPMACVHTTRTTHRLILRWYNGVAHAQHCPFARGQDDAHDVDRDARATRLNGKFNWGAAAPRAQSIDPHAASTARSPYTDAYVAARSLSPSGRVLLKALARCGLDQVHVLDLDRKTGKPGLAQPAKWLNRMYRLLDEKAAGDLEFRDVSTLDPRRIEAWLHHFLPNAARAHNGPVRGVLIAPLEHAAVGEQGTTLTLLRGEETRQLPIVAHWHRGHADGGPCWILATAECEPGEDHASLVDAYLHPAYSSNLPLPIDEPGDRILVTTLLDQLRFWARYPKTRALCRLSLPAQWTDTPLGPTRPTALISTKLDDKPRLIAIERLNPSDQNLREAIVRSRALPGCRGLVEYHPGNLIAPFQRAMTMHLFYADEAQAA